MPRSRSIASMPSREDASADGTPSSFVNQASGSSVGTRTGSATRARLSGTFGRTMSDQMHSHARSFGPVAEAYDAARPSYPDEAVSWLVGPGTEPRRILELGAGTGKLTELLVAAGHQVIATDPLPAMLDLLTKRAPGAQALVGTAESIPVASRSIDVVISAQAFHWFDHGPALAEIARVLRPGGTFSLVWNARDEGIPWVRKLGKIIGTADNRT